MTPTDPCAVALAEAHASGLRSPRARIVDEAHRVVVVSFGCSGAWAAWAVSVSLDGTTWLRGVGAGYKTRAAAEAAVIYA